MLAASIAVGVGMVATRASAHHVPGHGASEGVRNLNSLGGGTGQATTRLALLQEFTRTRTSLTPGSVYNTSLLGEYSPHPWVSFGGQFPMLVTDQDPVPGGDGTNPPPQVGYGDTRAFVRLTPHADKLIHRLLTAVITVSVPTRTVDFVGADPGRLWVVSPTLVYSRTYSKAFWQVIGVATVENRAAGTAVEVSGGGQIGYRLWGKLSPSFGALADVRALTFCTQPPSQGGGQQLCPEAAARTTEDDRPMGATRISSLAGLTWAINRWGLLSANVQLPVLSRRDFDVAGSLTFQVTF
ncbi:MAG: hypothetical protein K0V04_18055 [Deltaproteobacteria bacterium]|nr:hypothetical protein [Deltaproteobacteria bacterium]